MADPYTIPKWLKDHITKWKGRLWLDDWTLNVSMKNQPHGKVHTADGAASQNPLANRADLSFRIGMEEGEGSEILVVHELLHVAHSRIDHYVEQVIIPQLPEAARQLAVDGYEAVNEPFVQLMADALVDIPKEGAKK